MVSIWFFIGISLLVNGVLIFGAGLYEYWHPPEEQECSCSTCMRVYGGAH